MSRYDLQGLWWEDYERVPGTRHTANVVRNVQVPETGWTAPKEFPNLNGEKIIGIDTETFDPLLLEQGPGGVTRKGHVVGVSIAAGDSSWYFPIAHTYENQRHMNMDKGKVLGFIAELFSKNIQIVGANLLYDLEHLHGEGVALPVGPLHDVQFAEALIDEDCYVNLDALGSKYMQAGKHTSQLYEWSSNSFGGNPDGSQRANIYRSPPTLVGPYAESDALLPLQVLRRQIEIMKQDDLWEVYRLECGLIKLLIKMRFRGVKIDLDKAERVAKWLREQAAIEQRKLGSVDVWSSASIARAFDEAGLEYTRTEAGNPSFTRPWLESQHDPLSEQILKVRMYEKAANPFVESYLLNNHINGRIHCQFNPLKGDSFGAVSGRFSSSNPNLQNIPSRDKVLGPLIRSLFVPDYGLWYRTDYSQVEYRALAHYAVGRGSDELRMRYVTDPKTDFHMLAGALVLEHTGIVLDRKPAKNFNFGILYGMGKDKTMRSLGVDMDKAERLYNAYFEALPCVKETYKSAQRLANRRGYIRTLLRRRRRFNHWETKDGRSQRKGVHAALNACLQGTAADIMKRAMQKCLDDGLFDVMGVPHLTVHDELDFSIDVNDPKASAAFKECVHAMQSCVQLKVPLIVDVSKGANWGECV